MNRFNWLGRLTFICITLGMIGLVGWISALDSSQSHTDAPYTIPTINGTDQLQPVSANHPIKRNFDTKPSARTKTATTIRSNTPAKIQSISNQITDTIQQFQDQHGNSPIRPLARGVGSMVLNPDQQQSIHDLQKKLGSETTIHMDNVSSTLRYLEGDLSQLVQDSARYQEARNRGDYGGMALALAYEMREVLNVNDPLSEFTPDRIQQNPDGSIHVFLQQQKLETPIWGAELGFHFDEQGDPYQTSGVYAPRPDLIRSPSEPISKQAAIEAALRDRSMADNFGLLEPRAEPMVYWDLDRAPVMCYRVHLVPNAFAYWQVFIAMEDGRVVHRHKATCAAAATGQAPSLNGDPRTVNSYEDNGLFYLIDTTLPFFDPNSAPPSIGDTRGAIIIADLQNEVLTGSFSAPLVVSTDPDTWDPAGVSVQHNFRIVEQYYRETFDRMSINDEGMNIIGIIHTRFSLPNGGASGDNAVWNPAVQAMFFGDGEDSFVNLPESLDVAGHEITHGVIEQTANLIYENQSGALNEHIADVFGAMVDRDEWLLGDGVVRNGPGLRDMQNPSNPALRSPQPGTFSEFVNLPNTPQGDNGGVHVNSGIPNRMTYLLAEGPQGIGREKTEQITYLALTTYLTQRSQFIDYRRAMISAATDLYGANSPEIDAIAAAFDGVEIFDGQPGDGGGEGTPMPSPAPPTQGDDFVLFLAADPSTFDGTNFQYSLNVQGAAGVGLAAPRFVSNTRPAISGDGSFALYVDSNSNLWITDGVNEQLIDGSGVIRTIAMSKDQRYVAFTTNNLSSQIHILDLVNEESFTYPLQIVDRNNNLINLKYADAMSFNFRGDLLYYDAAIDILVPGQDPIEVWGIYSLRVVDGVSTQYFPPIAGRNIGFPMLANTSDHDLLADILIEEGNDQFSFGMLSIDLITQEANVLPFDQNTFGHPTYRADDTRMIFRHFDGQDYQLIEGAFNAEGDNFVQNSLTPLIGHPAPLSFPIGYREGEYTPVRGEIAVAPEIDFGNTEINEQNAQGLIIANQGQGDLQIIEIAIEGEQAESFGYQGTNQTIPAQESLLLHVAFQPLIEGINQATMRIRSTDPNQPAIEVNLMGFGQPSQAPTQPPSEPSPTFPVQPTFRPTATPPFIEPTATLPAPQPTSLPPDGIELLANYEFDKPALSENGWSELPGGFAGLSERQPGSIVLELFAENLFEESFDNRGLTATVADSQLIFLFTTVPIDTGGDPLLLRAHILAEGGNASLAVGALRGGLLQSQDLLDGSLGGIFPNSISNYESDSGWVNLIYQPDAGLFVNPFLQIAHSGEGENVTLYLDRIEIYRVPEEATIPANFVHR